MIKKMSRWMRNGQDEPLKLYLDSPTNRFYVTGYVSRSGHSYLFVTDHGEHLRITHKGTYDFVTADAPVGAGGNLHLNNPLDGQIGLLLPSEQRRVNLKTIKGLEEELRQ